MSSAPPTSDPRPSSARGESGRPALDLVHRLLAEASADWSLPAVAAELAAAFGTAGAGLADLVTGVPVVRVPPSTGPDRPCPWQESAEVL